MAEAVVEERYTTFEAFFPFYLKEHSNKTNRRLHFVGTSLGTLMLPTAIATGNYLLLLLYPVLGYGFAWFGHFIIEKNRPATFKYPLWSLMGDYKMWFMMATGKL